MHQKVAPAPGGETLPVAKSSKTGPAGACNTTSVAPAIGGRASPPTSDLSPPMGTDQVVFPVLTSNPSTVTSMFLKEVTTALSAVTVPRHRQRTGMVAGDQATVERAALVPPDHRPVDLGEGGRYRGARQIQNERGTVKNPWSAD